MLHKQRKQIWKWYLYGVVVGRRGSDGDNRGLIEVEGLTQTLGSQVHRLSTHFLAPTPQLALHRIDESVGFSRPGFSNTIKNTLTRENTLQTILLSVSVSNLIGAATTKGTA